jgi:tetratricopeptide (TPR) repeat protein
MAVVLGVGRSAIADDVPQRARELAERGRELHDAGEYAAAAVRFQEAYALAPSASLLFNLAQDYRLSGDCEDAAIMYRRFLATDPSPDARVVAQQHLDKVTRCIVHPTLAVTVPPPAPTPVVERPPPDPVQADIVRRPSIEKDAGIGLTLAGAVALGGAAYYAWRANDDSDQVSKGYASGVAWNVIASKDADGHRSQRIAEILGIGGGLSAASGVTLYMLGVSHDKAAHFAVSPTTGGAKVAVAWAF